MASFVKYNQFSKDLSSKVHDLSSDALTIALSNTAPDAAADEVLADATLITEENGYSATALTSVTLSESSGTTSLSADDVTFTATAGGFGPFRYILFYNNTPSSPADPLIGYWDYGSSISVAEDESFVVDFGSAILTVS